MIYRMGAALLSLVGLLISAYLYLYKIGLIGALACGSGECETVQASVWSRFAGVEVALIGVAGYLVLLIVTGWGVLFSGYLTYLELFVIHAICRWCVGSALIITSLFALALLARRVSEPAGAPVAEAG